MEFKPAAALLAASPAIPRSLAPQWLNYRAAGVPRTRHGKLNLDVPTPRTSWGKPDLPGIWYLQHPLWGENGGCGD